MKFLPLLIGFASISALHAADEVTAIQEGRQVIIRAASGSAGSGLCVRAAGVVNRSDTVDEKDHRLTRGRIPARIHPFILRISKIC